MSKTKKSNEIKLVLIGVIVGIIGAVSIMELRKPKITISQAETKENTETIVSNITVNNGVKKHSFILDTKDAKRYVDINIPDSILPVKHMYYTMIDLIAWQMNQYPDLESVQSKSKDILLSTFCLANSIQQKDVGHVYKVINLLISWNQQYVAAYSEMGTYLSENLNNTVPLVKDAPELCSIFNIYPVKQFDFLYNGDNNET